MGEMLNTQKNKNMDTVGGRTIWVLTEEPPEPGLGVKIEGQLNYECIYHFFL